MSASASNVYGDNLSESNDGRGVDIASQRQDALDDAALKRVSELVLSTHPVTVCELGTGRGVMAVKFAEAGAERVDAIDLQAFEREAHPAVRYLTRDLRMHHLFRGRPSAGYDLLFSQRTIHYLTFNQALRCLGQGYRAVKPGGSLFLSASGLASELSKGYSAAEQPVRRRFAPLGRAMAEKHGIHPSVCLYRPDELVCLVELAGFSVTDIQTSSFGNLKLIAQRPIS